MAKVIENKLTQRYKSYKWTQNRYLMRFKESMSDFNTTTIFIVDFPELLGSKLLLTTLIFLFAFLAFTMISASLAI